MAYWDKRDSYERKYSQWWQNTYEMQLMPRHLSWKELSAEKKQEWKERLDKYEEYVFSSDFRQH